MNGTNNYVMELDGYCAVYPLNYRPSDVELEKCKAKPITYKILQDEGIDVEKYVKEGLQVGTTIFIFLTGQDEVEFFGLEDTKIAYPVNYVPNEIPFTHQERRNALPIELKSLIDEGLSTEE